MKTPFKYVVQWEALSKCNEDMELDTVSYKKTIFEKNILDARKKALQTAKDWDRSFEDGEFVADFFKLDWTKIVGKDEQMPYAINVLMETKSSKNSFPILSIGNFHSVDSASAEKVLKNLMKEHQLLKKSGITIKEHEQLVKYYDHKDKKNKKGYILPNGMDWKKPQINILSGAKFK